MSQVDPGGTESVSPALSFSDYVFPTPALACKSHGNGENGSRGGAGPVSTPSPVMRALECAADRTSTSIAHGTRQSRADIRDQLTQVTKWLGASMQLDAAQEAPIPPVIAREYVTTLRANFLVALDSAQGLDAREVVRSLRRLDEAEDAWRRTDRGKFITRLTGSDCADAIVAIAHDIRSPLCSILLLVDSLRRAERGTVNAVRDRQLGLIYGAALGLSTTVSNLIGAARGEGLVQGQPLPFSVTEVMHAVEAIVQPMSEEKELPLKLVFPISDGRIGYASAIHQSLLNLTANALRYTETGSVTIGCTEVSGNRLEFWVEDTGPGIPDDVLERLCYGFPPEGVKLRFSSAGLGLAIVRTLVEAMGSTLQVDSGSEGTRFSFVLELAQRRISSERPAFRNG